jgi:hypothetical protein
MNTMSYEHNERTDYLVFHLFNVKDENVNDKLSFCKKLVSFIITGATSRSTMSKKTYNMNDETCYLSNDNINNNEEKKEKEKEESKEKDGKEENKDIKEENKEKDIKEENKEKDIKEENKEKDIKEENKSSHVDVKTARSIERARKRAASKQSMKELNDIFERDFDELNPLSYERIQGKRTVKFLLKRILRQYEYTKWFDAIGMDIETKSIVVLPVRNNIVDNFVETHWPPGYPGDYYHVDQWNLYEILVAKSIPLIWSDENAIDYWMPVSQYSNKTWKKLNHKMKKHRNGENNEYIDYQIWVD